MSDLSQVMSRQIQSLVRSDATVELSVVIRPEPLPGPDEVLVRIEAAPINPSDLGLLLAGADPGSLRREGSALVADLSNGAMRMMAKRVGVPMAVGNEGAGTVIRAGASAQALVGRTVAVMGGAMYGELRCVAAADCLVLPEGTEASDAAGAFVNPLTVLCMIETMRAEGHTGLVHTAAASNVGRMLNRVCLADGIPLVNIVRRDEHEELLRSEGARHVCNSTSTIFMKELVVALGETSATLGFDAVGGGLLASQILTCMEAAAAGRESGYSLYGTETLKQVYVYGGLDPRPTELRRSFGMTWGVGGWLFPIVGRRIGVARFGELKARVAAELTTTFATTYGRALTMDDLLDAEVLAGVAAQTTEGKALLDPRS